MNSRTASILIWVVFLIGGSVGGWFFTRRSINAETALSRGIETTVQKNKFQYIGDRSSREFHRPDCPIAATIDEKYRVLFRTRDAAVEREYTPCPRCQP